MSGGHRASRVSINLLRKREKKTLKKPLQKTLQKTLERKTKLHCMKTSWKLFSDSLINDIHSFSFLQSIARTLNADDDDDDDFTIPRYVLLSVSKLS
jgi:hypothetical protein